MPAMFQSSPRGPGDKQCKYVSNEIRRSLDEVRDDFGEVEGIDDLDSMLVGSYIQHCFW